MKKEQEINRTEQSEWPKKSFRLENAQGLARGHEFFHGDDLRPPLRNVTIPVRGFFFFINRSAVIKPSPEANFAGDTVIRFFRGEKETLPSTEMEKQSADRKTPSPTVKDITFGTSFNCYCV